MSESSSPKPESDSSTSSIARIAAARFSYANTLLQLNKPVAALKETETLLQEEPRNPIYRDLIQERTDPQSNQENNE